MAQEFTGCNSHNDIRPIRAKIRNFPRYAASLSDLPLEENIRLVAVADFIATSFRPRALPIVQVEIVGHADKDFQRGSAFEQSISEERARLIEASLRKRTFTFSLSKASLHVARPATIQWSVWGVGAKEPDDQNVMRGKNPSNMTEQDRKLNRRVEIFLKPSTQRMPFDPEQTLFDILDPGPVSPILPPSLPDWFWHWLPAPNKNEWERVKKQIQGWVKFRLPFAPDWSMSFDTHLLIETAMDELVPDPPPQRWDNVLQGADEADKARTTHAKEGAGSDDDD
jgi:hypothetical protein